MEWRFGCSWPSKKSWSKYPYFRILKEPEVSLGEVTLSTCYKNLIFKIIILCQARIKFYFFLMQDTCLCFRAIALEALLRRALCVVAHFCFLPVPLRETWERCVILKWYWFTLLCAEYCSCPTKDSCPQSSNSTATPARFLLSPPGQPAFLGLVGLWGAIVLAWVVGIEGKWGWGSAAALSPAPPPWLSGQGEILLLKCLQKILMAQGYFESKLCSFCWRKLSYSQPGIFCLQDLIGFGRAEEVWPTSLSWHSKSLLRRNVQINC